MPKLLVAMEDRLLILDGESGKWREETKLAGKNPHSLARDPLIRSRFYCASSGQGVWLSDDSGNTWRRVGTDVINPEVTSIAVSPHEEKNGFGVVYAGTEPSALYRSDDGGETWKKPSELSDVPSSKTWSFPPKPYTHHVRFITVDPSRAGLIYLAIEAGALIRSFDGGKTWRDRVRGGPYDTHTMTTNPSAPGRLYSAAGDGYFESKNYGDSWQRLDDGLDYTYLYCVAVHPKDPDTVLVSASPGPWRAYNPENAESYIYKKVDGRNWKLVSDGLHQPEGTTVSVLTPDLSEEGKFYAANNLGIFVSRDAGSSWEKLNVPWQESYKERRPSSMIL